MLAVIIAVPFAVAGVILLWCMCRAAAESDKRASEALRRYREHAGDDYEEDEWRTS